MRRGNDLLSAHGPRLRSDFIDHRVAAISIGQAHDERQGDI
jgi:hypothetical protein